MNKHAQAYDAQQADFEQDQKLQAQAAEQASASANEGAELSNDQIALCAKIDELSALLAAEKDAHMRAAAEFENIKKRIERQHASDLEYANSKILKDLLPVLDALDQAAAFEADDEFSAGIKEGICNISRLFSKVLADYGVAKISPNLGDAIDPDIHEVLLNQPNSELEPGTISMVMQCGYKLKDRTIRAAKVAANN